MLFIFSTKAFIRKCFISCTVVIHLCFLISCSEDIAYSYTYTFENSIWNVNNTLNYQFQISDTSKAYDINFEISNNDKFPNSNLWLFVKVTSPKGLYQIDTLNYSLSDETGKWLGKGLFGSWDSRFQYKSDIRFLIPGDYSITVKHGMRFSDLPGINNLALQLIQVQRPE